MKRKHTPAPWFPVDYAGIWILQKGDSYADDELLIAYNLDEGQAEANAKLAAAAPEMLEVLETIENDNNQVPEWLWKKIQEVIKKATE